jgi:hypothetical protein
LHGDSFRLKKNPRPLSERIPVKLLKNAPRIVPAKTVPDCEGDPAKASYLNNTLSKRCGPLPVALLPGLPLYSQTRIVQAVRGTKIGYD